MITEIKYDLFDYIKDKSNCVIVHCVSADFAMGKGFALKLKQFYNLNRNHRGYNVGECAIEVVSNNNLVVHLITKERYFYKPTLTTLRNSLTYLIENYKYNIINKDIIMPRIGCGLDKLSWNNVKSIINEVLIDYNIIVCNL